MSFLISRDGRPRAAANIRLTRVVSQSGACTSSSDMLWNFLCSAIRATQAAHKRRWQLHACGSSLWAAAATAVSQLPTSLPTTSVSFVRCLPKQGHICTSAAHTPRPLPQGHPVFLQSPYLRPAAIPRALSATRRSRCNVNIAAHVLRRQYVRPPLPLCTAPRRVR